jgi:hypothetical protein
MQLANRPTDQSKLFPVIVLLQYARLSYSSQCAILGCFVQIRTASAMQADGNVLRKFRIREERVFRSSVSSRAPAVNRSGPRLSICALGCLSAMSPSRGNHRGRLPRAGVGEVQSSSRPQVSVAGKGFSLAMSAWGVGMQIPTPTRIQIQRSRM